MDLNTTINLKTKTVIENSIDITLQEIVEMFSKEVVQQIDNYYIYDSEPELSTDDYDESVTVNLTLSNRRDSSKIIEDAKTMFEESLEEYFKDKIKAASLPQKEQSNENHETGEVGL